MKTYAFVGPSGTGKSFRATELAKREAISYIIDDGILIKGNSILAGKSAKLSKTKVGTLKRAVFYDEEHREDMREAIRKIKPDSILVLGTSDGMVEKIRECLDLPPYKKTFYIDEIATKAEQEKAKSVRLNKGLHVVPVATFELKKDFSGMFVDPLKWMRFKGSINENYDTERSVVRPTFSMLGKYIIVDSVLEQIIKHIAVQEEGVQRVTGVAIKQFPYGVYIQMEIVAYYGQKLKPMMRKLQVDIADKLEVLTSLFAVGIDISVASLTFKKE